MALTLLLDLDDTIFSNSLDDFLPAYLKAIAAHMAAYAPSEKWVKTLQSATASMAANDSPQQTLKERFDEDFYPRLGLDPEEMSAPLIEFYQNVFPELKRLTEMRPEGVELVREAQRRGYRIAIATTPLFPKIAILERMKWAGLADSEFEFAVVPSYEDFHFSKPNAAYFAELLAQMGWPEQPVLMVGNDYESDVLAARSAGLAGFWVTREKSTLQHNGSAPAMSAGWLDDVIPWIDSREIEQLAPRFESPEAIVAVLKSTPAAIHTLIRGLDNATWHTREQPDAWSLTEILCHLRDVEREVNLPRLKAVLQEDSAFIEGQDTDTWVENRQYAKQDGLDAFQKFLALRLELLDTVKTLQPRDWERKGRHTIFGPTTLRELVGLTAQHERLHLQQIHRAATTQRNPSP